MDEEHLTFSLAPDEISFERSPSSVTVWLAVATEGQSPQWDLDILWEYQVVDQLFVKDGSVKTVDVDHHCVFPSIRLGRQKSYLEERKLTE